MMAKKKVRSTTLADEAADPAPGPTTQNGSNVSHVNYDDLPVPEGIEILFDSEPPSEISIPEMVPATAPELDQPNGFEREPPAKIKRPSAVMVPVGPASTESPLLAAGLTTEVSAIDKQIDIHEKYILVVLAGAKYAVPLSHILQVGELEHYTPVPNVPDWIVGVINLRGDIISIVDVRALLNLGPDEYDDANSFLVTQTLEGDITACLLVERMLGIANISPFQIQNSDAVIGDRLAPFVSGLYSHNDGILSVLNVESLLRSLDITHYRP